MQKQFRKVYTALREHGRVGFAKMATIGGLCDNIDLLVIKATAPDDMPLPETHIYELSKIFSISHASIHSFTLGLTRRFGTTRSWRVALKCLLLLHRLLQLSSAPLNNIAFRSHLVSARANGLISLYPCHFQDDSSSASQHYTSFIKSYANLLNESLNCVSLFGCEEEQKVKEMGRINLELLAQLQGLIDKVMDCRPTKIVITRSLIARSAMKHIIRDSFDCYARFRREMGMVLDNLLQMPYTSCLVGFGIYEKAVAQANQLCEFYDWCKGIRLCGLYEYPFIDRIPHLQIQALETLLNEMWKFTDSASSLAKTSPSPSSLTEDYGGKQVDTIGTVDEIGPNGSIKKGLQNEEESPLIKLEDSDEEDEDWETLLEQSISCFDFKGYNMRNSNSNSLFFNHPTNSGYGYSFDENDGIISTWKPDSLNPFIRNVMQYKMCSRQ